LGTATSKALDQARTRKPRQRPGLFYDLSRMGEVESRRRCEPG
jgi:hypothetical protein